MSLPDNLKTQTPSLKYLTIILLITLPLIGFILGIKYQSSICLKQIQKVTNTLNEADLKATPTEAFGLFSGELHNQCPKYGLSPKSEFLESYTVKPGDTLLSIAQNVLGDPSRVNDIVILNTDRYPELSLSTPFIEQGWVVYLPPDYVTSLRADLSERSGEVMQVTSDGSMIVRTPKDSGGVRPGSHTRYPGAKEFMVGDCVTYITEIGTGTIYSIIKQDQNGPVEKCIDSNQQCQNKPDGTSCNYGVWCDEKGKICGGQSCVGSGLGECVNEKCELI